MATTNSSPIPNTYRQAAKHPQWQSAMETEFQALQNQNTWTLVPAPTNKPAPRQWFQKLTGFLQTHGFRFSHSDPSLLLHTHNNTHHYLLIYVDDILVTGDNSEAIQTLIRDMQTQFAMKQLGQIDFFLGIQVQHTKSGYFLTQIHHATKLLHDNGFADYKAAPTPFNPITKNSQNNIQPFADTCLYLRLAVSLQYLTITRPDIAYATNRICQHLQQPTCQDYQYLKSLLRYIKGTLSLGLPITKGKLILQTYTDADWAANPTDRKSVSVFCTFLGPNLISWTVKKQITVAKSSTEAEYRALSAATSKVIWIRRLVEELQLVQYSPTPIHCDNISAIAIAKNPIFHARTKHIEIDYQFISQHLTVGNIVI
ncbi:uncharacterized protein LOC110099447 [Dendrobium catenatum]|uniref:uncharacterized protein LOC110099447 n=1 Tax=Dendrobium catenatum TaxID=906689 RepID=UPI0009F4658B|nr:uncharacterized protein LOC110099447 [Dendrobium catenatum]